MKVKAAKAADITIYNFADDLQANVKGAELVSVEVSSDACSALIVVKGEIAKNQPTPTPTPRPMVPNTGVEGAADVGLSSYIGLFGGVVALAALRKKK